MFMDKFIELLKEELKKFKELEPPQFIRFVKTGAHKERSPQQKDFWYIRVASILRKLSRKRPISVEDFRIIYGGRKKRGVRPERFYKAGGKHIRLILQKLEGIGFVKKTKKGRVITNEGIKFINQIWRKLKQEEEKK
ncbi:MAG: 30S ribosomal protein S19e [Candidatus Aenigmarchaeota archaeon]|nr:30S ribosomal protein S19e [Candidatus Aenigmarchaeota archaeon]MDW8149074.1 30S ribosomal protein S19e [Candidatus Aenigmarchaeota archaeon]